MDLTKGPKESCVYSLSVNVVEWSLLPPSSQEGSISISIINLYFQGFNVPLKMYWDCSK